jgi:hypothetical protein
MRELKIAHAARVGAFIGFLPSLGFVPGLWDEVILHRWAEDSAVPYFLVVAAAGLFGGAVLFAAVAAGWNVIARRISD